MATTSGAHEAIANAEVVRRMYDAFLAKDEAGLRRILHPEVEWIQCAGFPGGGHRHGADEVLEKVFAGLHSEWDDFRADIEEYLEAGDRVVALGRYVGKHATTHRSMTAVFAHVYDLEEGRITRFRQFTDTYELVKAMQP